jgi:hypothetical protein
MVYANVRMNPYLGGAMKSFDASDAMKMRGVESVVSIGSASRTRPIRTRRDIGWRSPFICF